MNDFLFVHPFTVNRSLISYISTKYDKSEKRPWMVVIHLNDRAGALLKFFFASEADCNAAFEKLNNQLKGTGCPTVKPEGEEPPDDGGSAQEVADGTINYIDRMYPEMWKASSTPSLARTSIRNYISNGISSLLKKGQSDPVAPPKAELDERIRQAVGADGRWTYNRYRATLCLDGKPFAIITPDGQNAIDEIKINRLLNTLNAERPPSENSPLAGRIERYLSTLAPHIKERQAGRLLAEAAAELRRLG